MESKKIEQQIAGLLVLLVDKWSTTDNQTARLINEQFHRWQELVIQYQWEHTEENERVNVMLRDYHRMWLRFENLINIQIIRWEMIVGSADNLIEVKRAKLNIAMWKECILHGRYDNLASEIEHIRAEVR